jgi:hypothetical protein
VGFAHQSFKLVTLPHNIAVLSKPEIPCGKNDGFRGGTQFVGEREIAGQRSGSRLDRTKMN